MVGRVAGVITALAMVGALLMVSQTSAAAEGGCGPVTLDMLFPGLDSNGDPQPADTEPPPESTPPPDDDTTSTTTPESDSSTTHPESTTTSDQDSETTTTLDVTTPVAVCRSWVYSMTWPLGGEGRVFSGFGVDRDGGERKHKGADIMAPKMAPVVAVADGTVSIIHNVPGDDCCWVTIKHPDGWQSWYIHLNNDTYLTDDGLGLGVRADLTEGSVVTAGEVIGWVGDSGNAEGSVPHLHFELRNPSGVAVDAVPSLQSAKSKAELESFSGPYRDDEGRVSEYGAGLLASYGILWSCDELGLEACPDRLTQPVDIAVALNAMTGLVTPEIVARQQHLSFQEFLPDYELPLVLGCDPIETCFQIGITSGDVARLADWLGTAQQLVLLDTTDDIGSIPLSTIPLGDARSAENNLRFRGLIQYCDPKVDNTRLINRAEAAENLLWWVWGIGRTACYDPLDPRS